MSLYIDLSQFLAVHMRTGIQRIGGELCRYFPSNALTPVRLVGQSLVALPQELIKVIGGYFGDRDGSADVRLILPVIFGADRGEFFREMPEDQFQRCRFVVYDLLPFTHPEFFPAWMSAAMFPYYHVIRRSRNCGFISGYTKDVYHRRLRRS